MWALSSSPCFLCAALIIGPEREPEVHPSPSAAAAVKSHQSWPTLCDPRDGSPPGSSIPSPGKNTGVGCHFLLQSMKVKSESEVAQWCLILCDPIDCSTPGFPVLYHLLELVQTHVHPLSSPSPPAFSLSQHQRLFWYVGSSRQVAKVLELQLQPSVMGCMHMLKF